jgi:hypothetical protein
VETKICRYGRPSPLILASFSTQNWNGLLPNSLHIINNGVLFSIYQSCIKSKEIKVEEVLFINKVCGMGI